MKEHYEKFITKVDKFIRHLIVPLISVCICVDPNATADSLLISIAFTFICNLTSRENHIGPSVWLLIWLVIHLCALALREQILAIVSLF